MFPAGKIMRVRPAKKYSIDISKGNYKIIKGNIIHLINQRDKIPRVFCITGILRISTHMISRANKIKSFSDFSNKISKIKRGL